jgi:four helix bundle protein
MTKIASFQDIDAWKHGHRLVLATYAATKRFPVDERYGLTNQMRRAAVSVTSNIAEGFARRSYREKAQFYQTSRGSLIELCNQIIIAKDVGYLTDASFKELQQLIKTTLMVLNAFISSTRTRF